MIVWRLLNSSCFFSALTFFIGLICLFQCFVGIVFLFIQTDFSMTNKLIEIDRFDTSFLFYILHNFVGLGFISTIFASISIYATVQRYKSLSFFLAVLWVRHKLKSTRKKKEKDRLSSFPRRFSSWL